jgi:hypothetical protein
MFLEEGEGAVSVGLERVKVTLGCWYLKHPKQDSLRLVDDKNPRN